MKLTEKLAILDSALDYKKLLTFKFSANRNHDYALINWFCKNGEMRVYKSSNYGRIGTFSVTLITRNLQLHLGNIYEGCMKRNDDEHTSRSSVGRLCDNEYVRRAWAKLKIFHYCTNNMLETPAEVVESFRGNKDYMFSNSRETNSSMIRNRSVVYSILNSLTPTKL